MSSEPPDESLVAEFISAARRGADDEISRLSKLGVPVDVQKDGSSAVHAAVAAGHDSTLDLLVEKLRANVDITNTRGHTATYLAARDGLVEAVRKLLCDHGADPNAADHRGRTPLFVAAEGGFDISIRTIIEQGGNPNISSASGMSPLLIAAQEGRFSTVRVLAELGASTTASDDRGRTAVFLAAQFGHDEVIRLLVDEWSAPANVPDMEDWTPVYIASAKGHVSTARLLMGCLGADADAQDLTGSTSLHAASAQGHTDVVNMLVHEWGASVDSINARGRTPIFGAVQAGRDDTVRALANLGANIFVSDLEGWTPVMVGCFHGQISTVRLLIEEFDVDPNTMDMNGWTLTLIAAQEGHDSIVQMLVSTYGANVDLANNGNRTPLYIASRRGNFSTVKVLCELGADATSPSSDQVVVVATVQGHQDVVQFVKEVRRVNHAASLGAVATLKRCILAGSITPPAQWAHLLPAASRAELTLWVKSSLGTMRSCYVALYGKSASSRAHFFRAAVAHDGHGHIQQLISSYLIPSLECRELLRTMDKVLQRVQSEPRASVKQYDGEHFNWKSFSALIKLVLVWCLVVFSGLELWKNAQLAKQQEHRLGTMVVQVKHCHEASSLGLLGRLFRSSNAVLSGPVIYRGCANFSNASHLVGTLHLPKVTDQVKSDHNGNSSPAGSLSLWGQNSAIGISRYDSARPWSSRIPTNILAPSHIVDETLSEDDVSLMFGGTYGPHQVLQAVIRLPEGAREPFVPLVSKVRGVFDTEHPENHVWDFVASTPGAFNLPRYDKEALAYVPLHGELRVVLASPSNFNSKSSSPLFPSLHPYHQSLNYVHASESRVPLSGFGSKTKRTLGHKARTVDLLPGDVLVVPPYFFHGTEASSEITTNLHIRLGKSSSLFLEKEIR